MIRTTGLVKTYHRGWLWWKQETPVLKGFDFEARAGEVTGVLGPNGAGKTTLFRILCGLEKTNGGQVEVNGMDPAKNPIQMRGQIALLPDDAGVATHVSGRNHLWIYGAMLGLDKPGILAALEKANQTLHLDSFWERTFGTYSKGQRARIALARLSMMPEASVFIFDEPSNGLDFEAVARLHAFIRQLAREGKTILVASHILSDLRHLCDRLVGIDGGQAATPEKLSTWLDAHAQNQARLQEGHRPVLPEIESP